MTESTTDNPIAPRWAYPWIFAATVAAALGVAVSFSAWADIYDIVLNDEEASHIWLVPIIVSWLLMVRRGRLIGYQPKLDPAGAVMVLAGWAVSTYGFYYQVQSLFHGGALLLVVGCFLTVMGAGLLRRLPAVFVALLFVIPVPGVIRQEIAIPLQTQTAAITQFIFELFAVELQRTGNLLTYKGVHVEVAEACNGMRMVFTLVSVCYVFAFATKLRGWVRVLILALSPVVALVCNVIRVIPTIWVYGHYSEEVAATFHDLSGWVMIFASFFLLMGFVHLLDWLQIPIYPMAGERGSMPQRLSAWIAGPAWMAVVMGVLAMGLATAEGMMRPKPADAEPYHQSVFQAGQQAPDAFGDWVGEPVEVPRAAMKLLKPNVILSMDYRHKITGEEVSFLLVHCKKAREMAGHYPPICYAGIGWMSDEAEPTALAWPVEAIGRSLPGMEYRFRRGEGELARRMVVANLLVMPNGEYLRNIDGVYAAAADYTYRFFGAGQVQVVFPDGLSAQRRNEIVSEFLEAYWPLLEAMTSASLSTDSTSANE